jgi:dihydrofolate reductase
MAKFVYGMNLSLDGYVDHEAFAPDPPLFRHWIDQVRRLTGSLYGRRLYEIMRYWDVDDSGWGPDEHDFAQAWRSKPKWVVSQSLNAVGPNATLINGDVATGLRALKAAQAGEIDVGGPVLANYLTTLGLIDEYHLYYHPVVLGGGAPFFAGPRPRLRLVAHDRIGSDAVRLTYLPA